MDLHSLQYATNEEGGEEREKRKEVMLYESVWELPQPKRILVTWYERAEGFEAYFLSTIVLQ
jgi:hypothetical protein